MPTRLMDVENLRLVNSNDIPESKESRRYTVLSHPWGRSDTIPAITTANLEHKLQSGFRLDSLSTTVRDAITVTKCLGIQFLWIDAICVIQDSREDWERELALVGEVYRHAYCTIATTSTQDQSGGFLKPRLPRKFVPIYTPAGFVTYLCELVDDFEHEVDGAPLNQTAWVFQQRLLSRRTIHFAQNQFYWQCGEGIRCETLTKLSQ
ncbi:hypothetical protein LCI18_007893 [Fusarium solani-melongenae]|uniref:Uncharacterized protein n=1 Tax=Fusarium solani subsp. cucurbitae TaxID=2747967 RepID=A0ACD3Z7A9_FUSSC|nr:hypothetical protein LCI18_007893 [Fusarium solani-melongenae]